MLYVIICINYTYSKLKNEMKLNSTLALKVEIRISKELFIIPINEFITYLQFYTIHNQSNFAVKQNQILFQP